MHGGAAATVSATDILLSEGVILLGAAVVFVILFRRLGLGAVLGYLIAGALVGPHGLGLIGEAQSKLEIAEIGIVLLLFLVGLELNPSRLWRLKQDIFGLGLIQVVVCGLALFALVFFVTNFTWGASVALGLPLALSSTAQVLPGLKSSGRINSPFGEKAFSILLFQDLAIVPMITIIAALSRAPDPDALPGWQLALYTVLAIAGLVLVGRFVLRPALRLVGRIGERELFVVVGLFTVLASAALMHALQLSTALGAFVAGVMLADSPYRHEIESDVEPFRSILLGLFFLAVGMVLDVGAIIRSPLLVFGLAAGVVIVKTGLIFAVAKLFRFGTREAFAIGLLLSQGGEFGFVLFSQAQNALLIAPEAASVFGAVVTLSMATTPFLLFFARRLEFSPKNRTRDDLEGPDNAPKSCAIVVGYGRFGQTVAQMLIGQGCEVTIIDKKPAQIEMSSQFDMKVYYGDGTRIDLLRRAGAEDVQLIIFCIDDPNVDAKALRPLQEAFPDAAFLVRVFDRRHYLRLEDLDLTARVREVFDSAIVMGKAALSQLGISEREIAQVEEEYRSNDRARLDRQNETGDIFATKDMIFRPGHLMHYRDLPEEEAN